jgi:hypothetical protein
VTNDTPIQCPKCRETLKLLKALRTCTLCKGHEAVDHATFRAWQDYTRAEWRRGA